MSNHRYAPEFKVEAVCQFLEVDPFALRCDVKISYLQE